MPVCLIQYEDGALSAQAVHGLDVGRYPNVTLPLQCNLNYGKLPYQ